MRQVLNCLRLLSAGIALCLGLASAVQAKVELPHIFGDHMVLQQGQKNRVWGRASAGEAVTVQIDKQKHQTKAGPDGAWHVMLDALPVGLINNAWGGSACEAWIRRDLLAADEMYKPLLERWAQSETRFKELSTKADLNDDEKKQLMQLRGPRGGNSRPANIYNGVLKSHVGYGIRGAIWYQGESNAGRAYQYRDMFPLMIDSRRKEWGQGDFPFYWVQLADFMAEKPEPTDSAWADKPVCNLFSQANLPLTPFRTDDWPGTTANNR